MRLVATISLGSTTLLRAEVLTAYDATGVEAGNAMRFAVLDAAGHDERDPRFDQFRLATSASDWAAVALRDRRDAVATVPCSMGAPMTTQGVPPTHARHVDPDEPVMVLVATVDDPRGRLRTTGRHALASPPSAEILDLARAELDRLATDEVGSIDLPDDRILSFEGFSDQCWAAHVARHGDADGAGIAALERDFRREREESHPGHLVVATDWTAGSAAFTDTILWSLLAPIPTESPAPRR